MDVWFTPHNLCLPLCQRCHQPLDRHGLKDRRGNYWHFSCYEENQDDLKAAIHVNAETIVLATQGTNASANRLARRILEILNENS
jgi:hypothetical protein